LLLVLDRPFLYSFETNTKPFAAGVGSTAPLLIQNDSKAIAANRNNEGALTAIVIIRLLWTKKIGINRIH
jgi:hypothetical protein